VELVEGDGLECAAGVAACQAGVAGALKQAEQRCAETVDVRVGRGAVTPVIEEPGPAERSARVGC
jgi:hypothetical protein